MNGNLYSNILVWWKQEDMIEFICDSYIQDAYLITNLFRFHNICKQVVIHNLALNCIKSVFNKEKAKKANKDTKCGLKLEFIFVF